MWCWDRGNLGEGVGEEREGAVDGGGRVGVGLWRLKLIDQAEVVQGVEVLSLLSTSVSVQL